MGVWPIVKHVSIFRSASTFLRYALLKPKTLPPPPVLPFSQKISHNTFSTKGPFLLFPSTLFSLVSNVPLHFKMFNSSHFRTAVQPFEELSQRAPNVQGSICYRVIDLIRSSTIGYKTVNVVHCLALKIGALACLPTSTSLLCGYSKAGDFGSSRDLFDEICYKDVVVWNAMITASIENRFFVEAMAFFVRMMEEGSGFDSTTLMLVVSASSNLNDLERGRVVHGLSVKAGMLFDVNLCNAFVDMYAKCSQLRCSECMFAEIENKDMITWNSIMCSCLHNGHPTKSLWYFKKMAFSGDQADKVSMSCAISSCSCLGELDSGKAIHAKGIKSGYEPSLNVSVGNSLISLYSQCGDIKAAEAVFGEMMLKDVVSWNAMIEAFALNEKIDEVYDLLHEMQITESVQPDEVTLVSLTSLCAENMLLREGRTVHGFAIRRQMISHVSVINSIIDMYSRCNNVKKAEVLFNSTQGKDLVSWNTMISGYSKNGYSREAQMLFKELLLWSSDYSLSTFLAVLSSCDSPECFSLCISLHCLQIKLGFSSHNILASFMMYVYINFGDLKAAFSLLRGISAVAEIGCWNNVIAGCNRNGYFIESIEAFNLMRHGSCVSFDSVTLAAVISSCGNLELLHQGRSLQGIAYKASFGSDTQVQNSLITMYSRCGDIDSARAVFHCYYNHNLCSWNCIISALSQNKESREALELFPRLHFEPNEITIVGILSASTQTGILRYGKQIHAYVLRFAFQNNSYISAALIDMYSNCGRLDIALLVFRHSQVKSIAAWNSMISAYGNHGDGGKAIKTFHKMCSSGTEATKSTFISLLSACSHSGLVNEGLWYYNNMFEKYRVRPETEHQLCVVDMLGRSGKLGEAYEFIKSLPGDPDPGVWGALLTACNYHGELQLGRKIAELLFELAPENIGYYISLSNMYVAAGSWEDAVEFRDITQAQRLKKSAGYSLIDVGFG